MGKWIAVHQGLELRLQVVQPELHLAFYGHSQFGVKVMYNRVEVYALLSLAAIGPSCIAIGNRLLIVLLFGIRNLQN